MEKAFPSKGAEATVVYQNNNVHSAASKAAIADFSARTASTKGMLAVSEVKYSPDNKVAQLSVPLPGGDEQDVAIKQTRVLRDTIIPESLATVPGATVYTTGDAASSIDFSDNMKAKAPLVFAFVLGLAFLLLLVTFRSIVIPIKAIILNLLSVAAAYGVLVLVFQHGWFHNQIGFTPNGAIGPWLPMFLFVILFGLSMDYHVFILTRIREAFDRGRPTEDAVTHGIKTTAGVVTSAAAVMISVFAIFATLSLLIFKQLGVGLAVAVLIDATIIRGVLLPATMKLLGDWNWYLPKWLEWLPRVTPEAPAPAPEAPAPTPSRPAQSEPVAT
jgi:RND superfamily putative drug exporter